MPSKYNLQTIAQISERKIFIDANILIYLFWPTGETSWETSYATIFRNLLKQNNELYVDFLIISEVINRVVRIEYAKSQTTLKFKDYRNSPEGQETLADIYLIIKDNILRQFSVVEKTFNHQELEQFLMVDELDFVDKATLSLCQENEFVLLTNDRDFKSANIDILTTNPQILRN